MGSNGASVNGNGREPRHDRVDVPLKPIAWVPKPAPRQRRRRWPPPRFDRRSLPLAILAALAVLILLVVGLSTLSSPLDDVPTIDDEVFVRAADARCDAAEARLAALPSVRPGADDDRADAARRYAVVLDDLVASLEELPVASADTAAVDGWFGNWHRHQRALHRLADAFEAGDDDARAEADRRRADALLAVRRFALANSMGSCVLGGGDGR